MNTVIIIALMLLVAKNSFEIHILKKYYINYLQEDNAKLKNKIVELEINK